MGSVVWARVLVVGLFCLGVQAQESRPEQKLEPNEILKALDRDYAAALSDFAEKNARYQATQPDSRPTTRPSHPAEVFLPRYLAFAEGTRGTSLETSAMLRAVLAAQWFPENNFSWFKAALKRLGETTLDDTDLVPLFASLHLADHGPWRGELVQFLHVARNRGRPDEVRAAALFYLIAIETEFRNLLGDDRDRLKGLAFDLEKQYSTTRFAAAVRPYVYDIEHLQVGMAFPELTAADVSGTIYSLPRRPGKVTLVSFLDPGALSSRRFIEEIRGLERVYKDGEVMFLSVISPASSEGGSKTDWHLPGRCLLDLPGPTTPGPLSRAFNVYAHPMTFVLDGEGVIRHRFLTGKMLDTALSELVVRKK